MKPYLPRAILVVSMMLAGCAVPSIASPAQPTTSSVASTSDKGTPPAVSPSSTPALEADFQDVRLIPDRLAGDWSVIGLVTNRSAGAIRNLELAVSLTDATGAVLARQIVLPALSTLGPGGQSPFKARFPEVGPASQVLTGVVSYQPANETPATVEIDRLERRPTDDGRTMVYGRVTNRGQQVIVIDEIVVMATSPAGEPLALSEPAVGLSVLGRGDAAQFAAVLSTNETILAVRAFSSARVLTDRSEPALDFAVPARIEVDQQGSPFVVGVVRNGGRDWTTADVIASLRHDDDLVALGELELPWPIAPGETQAFVVDQFPGLRAQMLSLELTPADLTMTAELDPAGSVIATSPPIALAASVTAQEVIEGTLYLKGTLANNGSRIVARPCAMAVLRSTQGEVLSAGFVVAGDVLAAGGSLPFVLTLRLPEGADPAMAEFDLRAAGSQPD